MKPSIPILSTAFLCTCGSLSAQTAPAAAPAPQKPAAKVAPAPVTTAKPISVSSAKPASAPVAVAPAKPAAAPTAVAPAAAAKPIPVSRAQTAPAAGVAKPAAKPAPVAAKPAPAVAAPAPVVAKPKPLQQPYLLDIAFGVQSVEFKDKDTQDAFLYGATISLSGYLSKTRRGLKNLLLTGDVGLFTGQYTDTLLSRSTPYGANGSLVNTEILQRENTQFSVPVHVTLAFELPVKNFRFRIGPTVGFTWVSIDSKFEGYNDISNPLAPTDPNSNGRQNVTTLSKSASEIVFSYGGTAGATWDITDRLRLDFQYRLTANGALEFGGGRDFGKSISHQATIGLGWRF